MSIFGKHKKLIFALLGLLLAGLIMAHVMGQIDKESLLETFSKIQFIYLLPVFIIYCANVFLRALRWRLFYPKDIRASLWASYCALILGNASNLIIPARGGDIIRVLAIGKLSALPNSVSLATIITERVFDLLFLCLFIAGVTFFVALDNNIVIAAAIILGISLIGIVSIIGFSYAYRKHFHWIDNNVMKRLPKYVYGRAHDLLRGLADGIELMLNTKAGIIFVAYTSVLWISELSIVYLVAKSVGIGLEILHTITVYLCTAVGTLIPLTTAQIGVFEFIVVSTLKSFGYDETEAFALGIVWHSVILLYPIVLGVAVWIIAKPFVDNMRKEVFKQTN